MKKQSKQFKISTILKTILVCLTWSPLLTNTAQAAATTQATNRQLQKMERKLLRKIKKEGRKFSPNEKVGKGYTLLNYAAAHDLSEVLESLLKEGQFSEKIDVNLASDNGYTPLHWAARNGNKRMVEQLLDAGANVNAQNTNGYTPLYWATKNGHNEVAILLLNNGANPNKESNYGLSASQIAREKDNSELNDSFNRSVSVGAFLEEIEECSPNAASLNDLVSRVVLDNSLNLEHKREILTTLKDRNANLNYRDSSNLSPLHLAVRSRATEFSSVQALMDLGAEAFDFGERNKPEYSPIFYCLKRGNLDHFRTMLDNAIENNEKLSHTDMKNLLSKAGKIVSKAKRNGKENAISMELCLQYLEERQDDIIDKH